MQPAHIHLLLNHAPLFALIGALVLIVGALLRKSDAVIRAGMLIAIAGALVTIPAYLSGEGAEESVEHLQGVNEQAMEQHEDAAMFALISASVAGAVALTGLVVGRGNQRRLRQFAVATVVVAAWGISVAARVNNLGGEIRHPEISQPMNASGQPTTHTDGD